MELTFEFAMTEKRLLEWQHEAATNDLKAISGGEKGPLGLTPDHIKSTPEWQEAFKAERKAFADLRAWNAFMTKIFRKEMIAERDRKTSRKTERKLKMPMRIKQVTRYEVDGQVFKSYEAAKDHCERNLEMMIRNLVHVTGLDLKIGNPGIYKLMEELTKDDVRRNFADALMYELHDDDAYHALYDDDSDHA